MSLSKQSILLEKVKKVLSISNKNILDSLKECCDLLRESFDHFSWVGFYFADFKAKTLHLKAFSGIPTKHTSIRFGKGICGQVAVSNQNFMVPDIRYQDNYIACSIDVKSELVVPLFFEEKNIGQIDIDSDKINPFSLEDELLLEACCGLISKTYGSSLLSL
jgi:GAF domain-containing protein|tara:strand:+ start:386 stop:871 length:486 start_codon:yes stop_codon:yes gene_type:complete